MILVFSGTGNSMFVARRLSSLLGDKLVSLPLHGTLPSLDHNRVIWVFPVYSWGVPPVVLKWMEDMDFSTSTLHFAVMTCGDDVGHTHRMWRRAVESKGWKPMGSFSVQMPNTYVFMKGFDVDSPELAEAKVKAAPQRIESIAARIEQASRCGVPATDDVVEGIFPWAKTAIVYPWFKRFGMSPKPFFANDACVSCGLCASSCPMDNITMEAGQPQWADHCAFCLRCYHICPHGAVSYTTATRGKGHYRLLISEVAKK